MSRLFILIHMLLATVLTGILIVVIVATPSLFDQAMRLVPFAVVAGLVIAIPPSLMVAKAILKNTRGAA